MGIRVLLVDGREEEIDASTWTITPEVGLKVLTVDEQGNAECPVEYHPRFWVRVTKGEVLTPKDPDVDDFTGGSSGG
jgi:hypothetical protein